MHLKSLLLLEDTDSNLTWWQLHFLKVPPLLPFPQNEKNVSLVLCAVIWKRIKFLILCDATRISLKAPCTSLKFTKKRSSSF